MSANSRDAIYSSVEDTRKGEAVLGNYLKILGSTILLIFVASSSSAHHSSAMYDHEGRLHLSGTVKKLKWTNPHVYIEIESTNNSGESVVWFIEGLPPSGMRSAGWSQDSIVSGEQIIVSASPSKNGERKMALGHFVVKADGTRLVMPSLARGGLPSVELDEPIAASSLSGRWVTQWNPAIAIQFFQPANFWSLTDKGTAAMEAYESKMDPGSKCIPEPVPYIYIFPATKNIEIGAETTTFRDEMGTERTIHMNADSHDDAQVSIHGHSIGRWEDDVLIVDTTHFSDHRRGLAFRGLASGQQKHLVERFELSDDKTTMQYSYWLEDPEYLTEPASGELKFVHRPDRPFVSDPCDLESAARYLDE